LTLYQYLEELPHTYSSEEFNKIFQNVPHLSSVPQPPTLPRILDKVIVNVEAKKVLDDTGANMVSAGLDDNSILAVPNHVVLNHLTASAIKNGTLGVGTTTRYRKKVSSEGLLEDLLKGVFHSTSQQCSSSPVRQILSTIRPQEKFLHHHHYPLHLESR
jgi:hypothetical protein